MIELHEHESYEDDCGPNHDLDDGTCWEVDFAMRSVSAFVLGASVVAALLALWCMVRGL